MDITPMSSSPDGVSFMVHKLGTEVGPLKQVRELVVNGIEAVEVYRREYPDESGFRGRVDVYVDKYYFNTDGVCKIAFADNGIGMDAHELRKYFNSLSETGKQQGIDKNFGVGAKISTAAWNPNGVEIRSWKNGVGHLVRLVYQPSTDRYGLERFDLGDESPDYVSTEIIDKAEWLKPSWIGDHGTVVVLLGRDSKDDTCKAPETSDISHKDYWLPHVLNRQFFQLPKGVDLRASIEMNQDRANIRKIAGYKPVLDEFSVAKGVVELDDAFAHWWILDAERKEELNSKRPYYHAFTGYKNHGHVAAIFRDELFDFTSPNAAIPVLQRFGIVAGYNRVVIYVEPKAALAVTMNLTRTSLVLPDGTGLPWARFADNFFLNMPEELASYVESQQQQGAASEKDFVKREISKYKDFLRIKLARRNPVGAHAANEDPFGEGKVGTGKPRKITLGSKEGSRTRPSLNIKQTIGDLRVDDIFQAFEPKWNWVASDDANLKDRAARFTHERGFLEINQDFVVLRELVDYGLSFIKAERREQHRERIEAIARQNYAVQLIWTVMSAMASFRNREGWKGDGFDKLVSEEALTAAVLPRVHLLVEVKRMVKNLPSTKRDLIDSSEGEDAA